MKYRIEIEAPDGIDPSTLLARMQEVVVELHTEFDDAFDDCREDHRTRVEDAVSVEAVRAAPARASGD